MADTKKVLAQVPAGSATTGSSLLGVDGGAIKRFPITALANLLYPVGSYYWSSDPTDPGTLFGGTWEAVENKFMFAASTSHPVGETGGAESVALSLNQMPAHSHSASTGSDGEHTHSASTDWTGDHTHRFAGGGGFVGGGQWGAGAKIRVDGSGYIINENTTSAGGHSHSVSIGSAGSHSHTVSVSNTGGSAAHNNMPPYITAYCWHRTA